MSFNTSSRKRLSWEQTCLRLAFSIAELRSEDPYIQAGACALKVDGNSFVLGYNGALPGLEIDWSDRDERRKRVIHAEANVLNRILPGEVDFMATTHLPCPECTKVIGQKRIKRVIYCLEIPHYPNDLSKKLAKEFNIILEQASITDENKTTGNLFC